MCTFEFNYTGGYWEKHTYDEKGDCTKKSFCPTMDVPLTSLVMEWERMVREENYKQYELYSLKEKYLMAEQKIINETDFKEIYGKNNEKIRNAHVKSKLSHLVMKMKYLEWSIDFINGYIPLLREIIRMKREVK